MLASVPAPQPTIKSAPIAHRDVKVPAKATANSPAKGMKLERSNTNVAGNQATRMAPPQFRQVDLAIGPTENLRQADIAGRRQ